MTGPDNHCGDDDGQVRGIPLPRTPADDLVDPPPVEDTETGAEWWWHQNHRGGQRTYGGHVERIGGAAGERLRGQLGAVLRDLLQWAARQQDNDSQTPPCKDSSPDDERGAGSGQ